MSTQIQIYDFSTHSMSHCKSSASPLVLSTPSTDAVSTLAPRRAHVTDEVFRLPPPLRHREPLVLWEISIFVPSQPTADVANRFVSAVLKPSPLVRQHLAYQAPAKEREKRHENPDQMWLYFLIKVFEGRSSSLFVLRTRMKFASRKEGKGNISHAVSLFMNTSASRSAATLKLCTMKSHYFVVSKPFSHIRRTWRFLHDLSTSEFTRKWVVASTEEAFPTSSSARNFIELTNGFIQATPVKSGEAIKRVYRRFIAFWRAFKVAEAFTGILIKAPKEAYWVHQCNCRFTANKKTFISVRNMWMKWTVMEVFVNLFFARREYFSAQKLMHVIVHQILMWMKSWFGIHSKF